VTVGYFEGIDSERGSDWRCADSMTLREFLGYPLTKPTPDHSTLCTTRQRLDVETIHEVFAWVLALVGRRCALSRSWGLSWKRITRG
jgi:transposase